MTTNSVVAGDHADARDASRGLLAQDTPGRVQVLLARAGLAILVCGMALLFAREMLIVWGAPDADLLDPFNDARTYLAAGERLNSAHPLYELGPGDRAVLLFADSPVPLLSPPPIAAIWRPLAIVPFGFALWVAAAWVALLGTITYLVMRIGLRAAVIAAALAFPIGEALVAANITAFIPALLVATWRHRGDARAGVVIGALAALKLTPGATAGWFVGQQRWRGLMWVCAGIVFTTALGLAGAGLAGYIDYAGVVGTFGPSPNSLSGATGAGWLSPATLIIGSVLAAFLWRHPRLSFVMAVSTMVIGSPALYPTTLTLLLAALAPWLPEGTGADSPPPALSDQT